MTSPKHGGWTVTAQRHEYLSIGPVPAMPSASRLIAAANKTMEIDAAAENAKGERLSSRVAQATYLAQSLASDTE